VGVQNKDREYLIISGPYFDESRDTNPLMIQYLL